MSGSEKIGPVTLTQIAGSPFYYARYRKNGRQHSRSLGTRDLEVARSKARDIAESLGGILPAKKVDHSFRRYALETIENDGRKVQRGERAATIIRDGKRILKSYCEETLADRDVRDITYRVLKELVDQLTDADLSSSTIRNVLVFISKTMKTAVRAGAIQAVPLMPEVSIKHGVRGWFSLKEYKNLLQACKDHAARGTKVRTQVITDELRAYVTFMVNTFMRPSDSKLIRHRHIEIVKTKTTQYIRITTEFSKTVATPIISMPVAVPIYERILKEQKAAGYGNPDDFVFLPKYKKRDFALEVLRRQFLVVCQSVGLDTAPTGEPRTLYSLRHTSIMFRLTKGDKVDLLTLARNARTSVDMIDRFYARHLTAEMNVEQLQSMR